MMTYSVGVVGSGLGAAEYRLAETLKPEAEARARYYAGEVPPPGETLADELGRSVALGETSYSSALDEFVRAKLALLDPGRDFDPDEIKAQAGAELLAAIDRDDASREIAKRGGTVAELRPDISPALAARLGIADPDRLLGTTEIASLLNGRRADGGEIEGKEIHKPRISIAAVFGIDTTQALTGRGMENVLAGKRVDGDAPRTEAGRALDQKMVDGAVNRFRQAMGVPAHRDATEDEIAHLVAGRTAGGGIVDRGDFTRAMHGTRPPVGFVDLTLSADKSVSVAWALAPTEAERAFWLDVHKHAVADAMKHVEAKLGFAVKQENNVRRFERGELGWITFQHYTARPAVDIVVKDSEGKEQTAPREVPLAVADPQLHSHVTVMNAVLTEAGRIEDRGAGRNAEHARLGSLDLDRLDGFMKEGGAIYQASIAKHARAGGVDMMWDQSTGAARVVSVPQDIREMFSKRSREALSAARELAKGHGQDWDALSGEQKMALIKAGAGETRNAKLKGEGDGKSDFAVWREQAEAAGYKHRSMLRPDEVLPALSDEQRHTVAYEMTQKIIEAEFGQRAKISGQDLRVIAARGLIEAGPGENADRDIAAVMKLYHRYGVKQDGIRTSITIGKDQPLRGKERWSVTTGLHERQETELIVLVKSALADRSAALSQERINRAAAAFLADNPKIDPRGEHWKKQHAMMLALGTGGRVGLGIGAAGSGKSTILKPLVEAWKADGREVYGATVAHRQAGDLGAAGIDASNRTALDPFLKRIAKGTYTLDRNSVVVVDEVGLVGTRQQLELMRFQKKHGFQLVQLGDEKQCQSVDAGPVIDLMRKAYGEEQVPAILTSIRQKSDREREIAGLFRQGKAAEALEMKRADGSAILVAGGWDATTRKVAELWKERTEANKDDPKYRLSISAETNQAAREIGAAIRTLRRKAGELGADVEVSATDRTGKAYKLALAPGDKVRLFDRAYDADTPGRAKVLANNGETVEIREITDRGMRVRNAAGDDGLIAWERIREKGGPVRLSYGYAATVNVSQGVTSTEHIHASSAGHGLLAYTALSRHERSAFLVIDEASARRRVAKQQEQTGRIGPIREADVLAKVAGEMSQQPVKASSLAFLEQANDKRRGGISKFQRSMEVAERIQGQPGVTLTDYEKARLALQPVIDQLHRVQRQAVEAAHYVQERGRSMRM